MVQINHKFLNNNSVCSAVDQNFEKNHSARTFVSYCTCGSPKFLHLNPNPTMRLCSTTLQLYGMVMEHLNWE